MKLLKFESNHKQDLSTGCSGLSQCLVSTWGFWWPRPSQPLARSIRCECLLAPGLRPFPVLGVQGDSPHLPGIHSNMCEVPPGECQRREKAE